MTQIFDLKTADIAFRHIATRQAFRAATEVVFSPCVARPRATASAPHPCAGGGGGDAMAMMIRLIRPPP